MPMLTFLLAAAMAQAAVPETADVPTVGDKAKLDHSTKKICRVTTPLGSRLGGVTRCRTAAEWAEIKAEARRTVERVQGSTSGCLKGPVCGD